MSIFCAAKSFQVPDGQWRALSQRFAGARTLVGQMAVSGHRWLSRRRQRQEIVSARPDDELEAVG